MKTIKILEIYKDKVVTDCGTATFHEVKKIKRHHCRKCWLCYADCNGVECGYYSHYRLDGKVGVFTIQNMPE